LVDRERAWLSRGTVAAEAVGQDQIGAGTDEASVAGPDAIGMVEIPRVGRGPRLEPEGEQAGAHGAVGAHNRLAGEADRSAE
jgi:hypothetical protein